MKRKDQDLTMGLLLLIGAMGIVNANPPLAIGLSLLGGWVIFRK